MQKNDLFEIDITSIADNGCGVGHIDGMAVFVAAAAPGDHLRVLITRLEPRYAYARIEEILLPSPDRIEVDCDLFPRCGGCSLRHIGYDAECRAKRGIVQDALKHIGGIDARVSDMITAGEIDRYRNKAQYPVALLDGRIEHGYYACHTHRIVPCSDCLLLPPAINDVAATACLVLDELKVTPFDEVGGAGLLRHVCLRQSRLDGAILLCLVLNGDGFAREKEFVESITLSHPEIASITINRNTRNTNVIYGQHWRTLYKRRQVQDSLCGVPVHLSLDSFVQVNMAAAECLYHKASELAMLEGGETLVDLYCGMGAIGLSMAHRCRTLVGMDVVSSAIEQARSSAHRMGLTNTQFICCDAADLSEELEKLDLRPDVVLLDPPRKGCGMSVIQYLIEHGIQRVVMISCNPATLARDLKELIEGGYQLSSDVYPVNMFPRTRHTEAVVALRRVP